MMRFFQDRLLPLCAAMCVIFPLAENRLQAAETFRLYKRPLLIPERGTVQSYVLETPDCQFSFLPPPNWVVKENASREEVVMMARDFTTGIRFKILSSKTGTDGRFDVEDRRRQVFASYPGAKITGEFPCYASNARGIGFDLERTVGKRLKIATRLSYIPVPTGWLEFSLTTPSEKLEQHGFAFGNFLTSFRLESISAK